jgi:putative Ca2+/H+ antiporter (TMEM165/GDT1 family)
MGARLPERTIKIGAALTFFFFAALLGYEVIAG